MGASTNISALDIEAGIGYSFDPLYYEPKAQIYEGQVIEGYTVQNDLVLNLDYDYDEQPMIGYIRLGHAFELNEDWDFTVFFEHLSLLNPRAPEGQKYGLNFIGAGIKYTIF